MLLWSVVFHLSVSIVRDVYVLADMAPPVRPRASVAPEPQEPQKDADHYSWKVHQKFCITVTGLSKVQLADNSKVTDFSLFLALKLYDNIVGRLCIDID